MIGDGIEVFQRPADWQSAKQQVGNLRNGPDPRS